MLQSRKRRSSFRNVYVIDRLHHRSVDERFSFDDVFFFSLFLFFSSSSIRNQSPIRSSSLLQISLRFTSISANKLQYAISIHPFIHRSFARRFASSSLLDNSVQTNSDYKENECVKYWSCRSKTQLRRNPSKNEQNLTIKFKHLSSNTAFIHSFTDESHCRLKDMSAYIHTYLAELSHLNFRCFPAMQIHQLHSTTAQARLDLDKG